MFHSEYTLYIGLYMSLLVMFLILSLSEGGQDLHPYLHTVNWGMLTINTTPLGYAEYNNIALGTDVKPKDTTNISHLFVIWSPFWMAWTTVCTVKFPSPLFWYITEMTTNLVIFNLPRKSLAVHQSFGMFVFCSWALFSYYIWFSISREFSAATPCCI